MIQNDETEILARLGILNSTEESPNKMRHSKGDSRRVRAVLNLPPASTSSLSDDSSDEIVFDRYALLNARKRRRRRRNSRTSGYATFETLKWKVFCLSFSFLAMGLATSILGLTKPEITDNLHISDVSEYASLFTIQGVGYWMGTLLVAKLFTRVNPYICTTVLLAASIPLTTSAIYQSSTSTLKCLLFFQGILFGGLERGAWFIVFGVWKGNRRVLFTFYAAFAVGAALCSILTTEAIFSRATIVREAAEHRLSKRGVESETAPTPTTASAFNSATRPNSAVGIVEEGNTKTQENEAKRKQPLKLDMDCDESSMNETECANSTEVLSPSHGSYETTKIKTSMAKTTPLPTTTVAAPTTQKTTRQFTSTVPFNRARNRQSSAATPASLVDQMKGTVLGKIDQMNTAARIAYFLVMIISLVAVLMFVCGFCGCCIRCDSIADVRIAQLELEASTNPVLPPYVKIMAILCWYLQSLPETIFLSLFPHLVLILPDPELSTQNFTAFFSVTFWLSVVAFRLLLIIRPSLTTSPKMGKMCYLIGVPSYLILHYLVGYSGASLFSGIIAMGAFLSSLPQLTFSWIQQHLNPSPYTFTKQYFFAVSLSRMSGPPLAAFVLQRFASPYMLMKLLTAIIIMGGIIYVLLSRAAYPIARQRHLKELTGDINGRREEPPNPKAKRRGQYAALIEDENQSDADVEMDYVFAENGALSDSSNSV